MSRKTIIKCDWSFWTTNRTDQFMTFFKKTCIYFRKSWINFFDPSLLLSTVMVHLNFSILNDKPSLFLPIFLCIGMYLAWVLGFFLEDFFLHWYKLESISKILCPWVFHRRIPFWWSEKVKKSNDLICYQ